MTNQNEDDIPHNQMGEVVEFDPRVTPTPARPDDEDAGYHGEFTVDTTGIDIDAELPTNYPSWTLTECINYKAAIKAEQDRLRAKVQLVQEVYIQRVKEADLTEAIRQLERARAASGARDIQAQAMDWILSETPDAGHLIQARLYLNSIRG